MGLSGFSLLRFLIYLENTNLSMSPSLNFSHMPGGFYEKFNITTIGLWISLKVSVIKTVKSVFSLFKSLRELGCFHFLHNAPK